jgi:hypothetical protein
MDAKNVMNRSRRGYLYMNVNFLLGKSLIALVEILYVFAKR